MKKVLKQYSGNVFAKIKSTQNKIPIINNKSHNLMKRKMMLFLALIIMSTTATFAQMQQMTVEQRVKNVMDKLAPLSLNDAQKEKTTTIFTDYYKNQQKMMEEARSSGQRPDSTVRQKATDDRDNLLKAVFSEDQFTKFKNEIEETLRPQRRNNQ